MIGDRSFNIAMWNSAGPGFAANYGNTVFVFNADGFAALSYTFMAHYKVSVGLRADYYSSALKTYDINTGGLEKHRRFYWGPFRAIDRIVLKTTMRRRRLLPDCRSRA